MDENREFNSPGVGPQPAQNGRRLVLIAAVALAIILAATQRPDAVRAAWNELERLIALKSDPLPASPAQLSQHHIEELEKLGPQQQAQLLVERAINHYAGANELLASHVDAWRGHLDLTPQFSSLLETAMNSNDLRVRAAGLEVYLAAYNLPKNPEEVTLLTQRIHDDPAGRPWALWMLGALGNRGVQPDQVFNILMDYINDGNEQTRYWAVEGLANLGADNTIQPLLDAFHNDASPQVRERAACSLAQSGMLAKEQRISAVPVLLNYMDDPSLDATTRGWVFQALRDITGAGLGSDPAAWRNWWAQHRSG